MGKKVEVLPKKRGPKPKYESWMCDKIIEVAEQGGHVAQMCKAINIRSQDTFFRWVRENEEFRDAYEESKVASQAFYENILLMGGLGKIPGFNFSSIAMVMNNKFPQEYKRSATGSNTEININTVELDSKQLDQKIDEVKARLAQLNYIVDDK